MSTETERDLAQEIASLDGLTIDGLRLCWQARFLRAAPVHLPKILLLRLYAYRLQAEEHGDLGAGTVRLLDRLGRAKNDEDKPIPLPIGPNGRGQLKAGTVLVREHAGVSHRVMVAEEGYYWNGHTFPSLSQVATAITGTRWNGPRFFGLSYGKATS
jgi:hypothetical protein